MVEPRRLRSIVLILTALALITAGFFGMFGNEPEEAVTPTVPVVPVLPLPPLDDEEHPPMAVPVLSVIHGLSQGEIGMPYRVAVWRDYVYVTDALALSGTIKVLDRQGNHVRSFGTLGVDGLSFIVDMDVDALGNIVVLDATPSLHIFSGLGEHLSTIEIDPTFMWAKSVQATRGEYYLLALERLIRMSDSGVLTAIWPDDDGDYEFATAPSEFYLGPSGLAASSRGLWVSDSVNSRLLLLDYNGRLSTEVSLIEEGSLSAPYPTSIAVSAEGHLYVVDALSLEVICVDYEGNILWKEPLEARTDGIHPEEIYDIALIDYNRLLITDAWSRVLEVWEVDRSGVLARETFYRSAPAFMFPIDVLAHGDSVYMLCAETTPSGTTGYRVYVRPAGETEVRLFADSFAGDSLEGPTRLAANGEDIYVLDQRRILVYGPDGEERMSIGEGNGEWGGFAVSTLMGEPMGPQGLAVCPLGDIYVADTYASRMVVFSKQGELLRQLPFSAHVFPVSVAFARDGLHFFVLNSYAAQVLKVDTAGSVLQTFGSAGHEEGQFGVISDLGLFDGPRDIAVDEAGTVYVLDTYNARLVKFSPQGVPQGVRGFFGSSPGEFYLPSGMYLDRAKGLLYIADTYNHRIQIVVVPC